MSAERSAKVAELLREEPPELDELRRARLERRFVEAAAARGGVAPAMPARTRSRGRIAVGIAVPLAAAAAVWLVWSRPAGPHFTIEHARGGEIAVGTVIEVAPGDEARAEVHHLDLVVSAGASVRFTSVEDDDVRLHLSRGAARFAFHPALRGREHVTIDTPSARVEIVGTELTVHVDERGTEVSVETGRVRVVPADGGAETFVSAGEHVRVAATATAEVVVPAAAVLPEAIAAEGAGPAAVIEPEAALPPEVIEPPAPEAPTAIVPTRAEATASADGVPSPAREESPSERLARLDEALAENAYEARRELRELAASTAPRTVRVDAYLLLGDSYRAEHANENALEAYADAARLGRGTSRGALARYERARLFEAMVRPADAAEEYALYLEEYPSGANAADARARHEALSR